MVKRYFDIVFSALGLLVSAPISLVIAARIFFEDGGPVFFSQKRVGKGGRLFTAYKFRSMKTALKTEIFQARENDQRITRFGKFLRSTALDEIPQLWNILKGDMSFVGPRPLLPEEEEIHASRHDEEVVQRLFEKRCSVLPGLTGVAQIFAPRDISRAKKFRYDLFYIRKSSFLFDLKLILISFLITFRGRWETRKSKIKTRKREMNV